MYLPTDTKSIVRTYTSAQRKLIKTYKTERFRTASEAESQEHRHFLNRTFCNGVGGTTTGLQTRS